MLHVDLDLVEERLDSLILKPVPVHDEGETDHIDCLTASVLQLPL